MKTDLVTRVLRVTSLKSFCDELSARPETESPKPILRLLNRQTTGQHSAALLLSLQGVNSTGEIVWLCEAHTISWLYGQPFGPEAESIYVAMRDLESVVCAYLIDHGYDVRSGDYGLPDDIKPLAASFECARWTRKSDSDWKVEVVAPAPDSQPT